MRAPVHYIMREPVALPLVAIALNVLVVGVLIVELRAVRMKLQVEFAASRPPSVLVNIPIVKLDAGPSLQFNNERIATLGDLEYRLSGRSASGQRLNLLVGPGVPADLLTQVLEVCARSGFTSVAIEMAR